MYGKDIGPGHAAGTWACSIDMDMSYSKEMDMHEVGKEKERKGVLDLVSQVRDVVLIECIFSSGRPQGVGILE
jgi:hypothetical protein